ncbi:hypothetical protein BDW22DRAFT_1357455 [Trametopsis cervina]|nr:hypothetical protein BDW22DRAFT_1357455 [Trametopsis cervina]
MASIRSTTPLMRATANLTSRRTFPLSRRRNHTSTSIRTNGPADKTVSSNSEPSDSNSPQTHEIIPSTNRPVSIAERDAMLMNAWKDREGSLANAEFEDGKVEEGYRRHVKANIFRYI